MSYTSPPWTLQGHALLTLNLIDIQRVRPLIPKELDIIPVLPGKTLGGVYLSFYGSGSILEYHELIVVAAITRYQDHISPWVSHIYVDNPESVAGGREIWGLPKEIAEFTWENDHVSVRQGDISLCAMNYKRSKFPNLATPFPIPAFHLSILDSNILGFSSQFKFRCELIKNTLEVYPESPFNSLALEQPWLTGYFNKLHILVGEPKVIGKIT